MGRLEDLLARFDGLVVLTIVDEGIADGGRNYQRERIKVVSKIQFGEDGIERVAHGKTLFGMPLVNGGVIGIDG